MHKNRWPPSLQGKAMTPWPSLSNCPWSKRDCPGHCPPHGLDNALDPRRHTRQRQHEPCWDQSWTSSKARAAGTDSGGTHFIPLSSSLGQSGKSSAPASKTARETTI
eukprot:4617957-Pyramimonas_sp.AAC.1